MGSESVRSIGDPRRQPAKPDRARNLGTADAGFTRGLPDLRGVGHDPDPSPGGSPRRGGQRVVPRPRSRRLRQVRDPDQRRGCSGCADPRRTSRAPRRLSLDPNPPRQPPDGPGQRKRRGRGRPGARRREPRSDRSRRDGSWGDGARRPARRTRVAASADARRDADDPRAGAVAPGAAALPAAARRRRPNARRRRPLARRAASRRADARPDGGAGATPDSRPRLRDVRVQRAVSGTADPRGPGLDHLRQLREPHPLADGDPLARGAPRQRLRRGSARHPGSGPPGGRFEYRIHFPDAGLYWYHPHHREEVQQDLGLYGNMLVEAPPDAWYARSIGRKS